MLNGKIKLSLRNAKTGVIEKEIVEHNLVTTAVEKFYPAVVATIYGTGEDGGGTYNYNNVLGSVSPLAKQGLGGLLVFTDTISGTADRYSWLPSEKMIAQAGTGGSSEDAEKWDTIGYHIEDITGTDYHTRAWEFYESQCNGIIKALALTNIGGTGTLVGVPSSGSITKSISSGNGLVLKNTAYGNTGYPALSNSKRFLFAKMVSDYLYYITLSYAGSSQLTLETYRYKPFSVSLANDEFTPELVHSQSVTPTHDFYNGRDNIFPYDATHGYIAHLDSGRLYYVIFDCSNIGGDISVETESSVVLHGTTSNSTTKPRLRDGYAYYVTTDTDSRLVKFALADETYEEVEYDKSPYLYPSINGGFVAISSVAISSSSYLLYLYYIYPDLTVVEWGSTYLAKSGSGSSLTSLTYVPFDLILDGTQQPFVGAIKLQSWVYGAGAESCIAPNPLYLGTIYNLSTPVLKTSDQILRIEYTLTTEDR